MLYVNVIVPVPWPSHHFIEMIQEVELLSQGADLALEIHSAQVRSIHILGPRETAGQAPQPQGSGLPVSRRTTPASPEPTPAPLPPAHLLEQHKLILHRRALVDFVLVPVTEEDSGQAQPSSAF